jgi:transcription elongation factor Elf1
MMIHPDALKMKKEREKNQEKSRKKYAEEVWYWTNHICPHCGHKSDTWPDPKGVKWINAEGDCVCQSCGATGYNNMCMPV